MTIQTQRRFIRVGQVSEKLGIGKSTVWYKAQHDEDFPSPFKISTRVTVWDESDIDAYMEAKKAAGALLQTPNTMQ